jgi:hypothetical protein
MANSKGSLVLSEAKLDDIPALSVIFPQAYHPVPYFEKMMPDTPANDEWWRDSHRIAILDPKTRVVKVTDQETDEIVAMARWLLPRDADEDLHPGSEEDRWPAFSEDFDRSLCDPMFESMARSREEFMKDRKHYCKSASQPCLLNLHMALYIISMKPRSTLRFTNRD